MLLVNEHNQHSESDTPYPKGDRVERQHLELNRTTLDRIYQARQPGKNEADPTAKKTSRPIRRFAKRNRHVVALAATFIAGALLLANVFLIKSSQNANWIALETVGATHRAWMTVDGIERSKRADIAADDYGVSVKWRNSGNSPVARARYYSELIIIPADTTVPHFNYSNVRRQSEFFHLAPQETLLSTPTAIPESSLGRIIFGLDRAVLYARVEYQDAYSGENWRLTEVTMQLSVVGMRESDSTPHPQLSYVMVGDQNQMN